VENQVEIVFVDYLGLVDVADGSSLPRDECIGKSITALKTLAVKMSIPIIVLQQISSDKDQPITPHTVVENSDVIIHIHQSGTKEWDLLVSKRLTIAR
jgi:replicative DNA helicase